MELCVRNVLQSASGGSHVTIYDAEVELTGKGVSVEVLRVESIDAHEEDVEAARDAICRGAEQVLQALGMGAIIRVERLVIHPVDFKPKMFERCTAEELIRVLTHPS